MEEIVIELEPEMLALPAPANSERVSPDDVPDQPDAFKNWSDWACIEWPIKLMVQACHAWGGLTQHDETDFKAFVISYRHWYDLPEMEKEVSAERECNYGHRFNARWRALQAFQTGTKVSRNDKIYIRP